MLQVPHLVDIEGDRQLSQPQPEIPGPRGDGFGGRDRAHWDSGEDVVELARPDQVVAAIERAPHSHVVVQQGGKGIAYDAERKLRRIGADEHRPLVALLVTPGEDVGLPQVPTIAMLRHEARRGR